MPKFMNAPLVEEEEEKKKPKFMQAPLVHEEEKEGVFSKIGRIAKAGAGEVKEFVKGAVTDPEETVTGLAKGFGEGTRQIFEPPINKMAMLLSKVPGDTATPEKTAERIAESKKDRVAREAAMGPIEKRATGVGEFGTKAGLGIAASTVVPGSGLGATLAKGAVANIPFVPKAFEEGGTKGALKDVALNTAIDAALFGAGKAIPIIKSAILKKAPNLAEDVVEQMAKESFEQVQKQSTKKITKQPLGSMAETMSGATADISKVKGAPGVPFLKDLPEAEARLLQQKKAPKAIPFDKYVEQAVAKKKNLGVKSTFQVAGENATKAFKTVDELRKKAGNKISEALAKKPNARVDIKDDVVEFMDKIKSDIGGVFDESGKLVDAPGDLISDASAVKDANDIFKRLNSIHVSDLTAKQAVSLKRYMQNLVKFTPEGQFKASGSSMDRLVKGLSANINKKLNAAVPGLEAANSEFARIKKLTDSMSKILGKQINPETGLSKHGASIMKRSLESLADSGISDMFRQVKALTGGQFDLFQDATYASIAARLSGDTRQIGQALPFGGIGLRGGTPTQKGADFLSRVAKKAYKGDELKRVLEFYKKSQKPK